MAAGAHRQTVGSSACSARNAVFIASVASELGDVECASQAHHTVAAAAPSLLLRQTPRGTPTMPDELDGALAAARSPAACAERAVVAPRRRSRRCLCAIARAAGHAIARAACAGAADLPVLPNSTWLVLVHKLRVWHPLSPEDAAARGDNALVRPFLLLVASVRSG